MTNRKPISTHLTNKRYCWACNRATPAAVYPEVVLLAGNNKTPVISISKLRISQAIQGWIYPDKYCSRILSNHLRLTISYRSSYWLNIINSNSRRSNKRRRNFPAKMTFRDLWSMPSSLAAAKRLHHRRMLLRRVLARSRRCSSL